MSLSSHHFSFIRELVRKQAGIVLDDGKEYLVEARLDPVRRDSGFESIDELVERLLAGGRELITPVVEALTTNETSFFRDQHPFDLMRQNVLPRLIERRRSQRKLRIWCAACSSGQEPVSLGILIRENFPELAFWDVKIVATDINKSMLERCRTGQYSRLEVSRGMPAKLLVEYFTQSAHRWLVAESVLKMIDYQPLNLATPLPVMDTMDVIFLRNVMIYFDREMKARILHGVHDVIASDGTLILGASESSIGLCSNFSVRADDICSSYLPCA